MTKTEILSELPKLSPAERKEIRQRLTELDGDGWINSTDPLTDAEKTLLEARFAAYEKDPEAGSTWEAVEARLRSRLKR